MSIVIENGVGNSDKLKINGRNEARVFAVTESESQAATQAGDAYNINTGEITSLTAGDASLIYFKNDEDEDFVVESIVVGLRGMTGLSDMATITIIKNPTGGDLLTDATVVDINENRNFGSSKTLKDTSFAYKGKAGGTITGGSDALLFYSGNNSRLFATIELELPKGSSLAIKVDSDATAGTAYCAIIGYIKDAERV